MRNNKEKDTREKKFILTDNRNGITLIALVVTIVVLLILAGVSISLILDNNGVIQKSKDARREYGQASENEQKELSGLSDWIETAVGKIEYNEELKALKPGDYVIYDTGIEGVGEVTCRVLYDAESPYNLQIITDDCIKKDGEYVYIPFGRIDILSDWESGYYASSKKEFDAKFQGYDFSEWYGWCQTDDADQYNNAITILNNKAMEFSNNTIADARCVGSDPKNKEKETKETAKIPEDIPKATSNISDDTGVKDEDDNYEKDYDTLQSLNILTTNKHYWMASRCNEAGTVYYKRDGLIFNLRNDGGYEWNNWNRPRILTTISSASHGGVCFGGNVANGLMINALRPVFTLKGNLKVVSGDGTSESTAYRLGV